MNWYDALKVAMSLDKEPFEEKVCTLQDQDLKTEDKRYFIVWGKEWIYYPIYCDNNFNLVGHMLRNPPSIQQSIQAA